MVFRSGSRVKWRLLVMLSLFLSTASAVKRAQAQSPNRRGTPSPFQVSLQTPPPQFVPFATTPHTADIPIATSTVLGEPWVLAAAMQQPPDPNAPLTQPVPPDPSTTPGETEFGESPPDYSEQFLRRETVLLSPGEWQFDYGLIYVVDRNHFPDEFGMAPVRTNITQRQLIVPFAFRYGLTQRSQVYADIPVGWSHVELSNSIVDDQTNQGGIGDIRLGLNYVLRRGDYYSPDVVVTFQTTLPTSNQGLPLSTTEANLGNGVWAASTQLLFVQAYDPVTAFWGLGYRYQWGDEFDGQRIHFGQQISYTLGVGFSVNDRVTLSTAFLGLFETETRLNGQGIAGTDADSLRLRFALTAYRNCRIIEPFATIGMTEQAPDAVAGIVWTY